MNQLQLHTHTRNIMHAHALTYLQATKTDKHERSDINSIHANSIYTTQKVAYLNPRQHTHVSHKMQRSFILTIMHGGICLGEDMSYQ